MSSAVAWDTVFDVAPDISGVVSGSGQLLATNQAWDVFGATSDADAGCGVGANYVAVCERASLAGDELAEQVRVGLLSVLSKAAKSFSLEYPCTTPTEELWFRVEVTALPGSGFEPAAFIRHLNVTEWVRGHQRLHAQASTDPLTGLPNRRWLNAHLQQVLNDPGRVVMVLLGDLDQFKLINDGLGHLVGDECLVQVAQWLPHQVRSEDLVARWGGDEFAVVLSADSEAGLWSAADRLTGATLAGPQDLTLHLSWGATLADSADTAESLLDRADRMLRSAKQQRKHCRQVAAPGETLSRENSIIRHSPARAGSAHFRRLFVEAPHGALLVDRGGVVVDANPSSCQQLGVSLSELVGHSVTASLRGLMGTGFDPVAAILAGQSDRGHDPHIDCVDAEGLHLAVTVQRLSDSDDVKGDILIHLVDVAERCRAENGLREARHRYERLFLDGPHGQLLIDPDQKVAASNPAAVKLLNLQEGSWVGSFRSDLPGLDNHETGYLLDSVFAGTAAQASAEVAFNPGTSDEVHVALTASALRDAGGRLENILLTMVDVSERWRFESQLAHLSTHDPLTGLTNRRGFDFELTAHVDRGRRYGGAGALMVMDLDNFKAVNDTLGHDIGDQLILSVADVLRNRLRSTDIVARLGGDEFAILLPHSNRENAEHVAQDIIMSVRQNVRVLSGDRPRRVTASIGVVLLPDTVMTAGELLAMADLTMYDAKEAGRDRVVVHDPTQAAVPRSAARLAWADRIDQALEQGSFVVHAQPILDVATGVVSGAELLLRMLDDNGELILPGHFLYIAERTNQIIEIDRFMIGQAIGLLARTQRVDPDFSIEVNLSGITVGSPGLADFITQQVQKAGIQPSGLVLEITETAAVANVEAARVFARRIGTLGCRFALDDFGAGFGSFYYLKHLRFDFVKIDGEFVANSPHSPADRLIIKSIVSIASGLGKRTIAEFVKDEGVLDTVTALGVDYAQGYHIARPAPVDNLLALLANPKKAIPRQRSIRSTASEPNVRDDRSWYQSESFSKHRFL